MFFWQDNETKTGNGFSAHGEVSITKLNAFELLMLIVEGFSHSIAFSFVI